MDYGADLRKPGVSPGIDHQTFLEDSIGGAQEEHAPPA
jgi:hypothetical protein